MKKLLSLSLLASALVLSACGGGGSEDAADKYVGTWLSKCHSYVASNGNTYFRKVTRVLTKKSATELIGTFVQKGTYAETVCTTIVDSNTYTSDDTKYTIGKSTTFLGATSDEITALNIVTNASFPGYMTVSGNQWFVVTYTAGAATPNGWGDRSPYTKQ